MRSNWKDMEPVDDFVTQQTPGLKITQKVWGDMQCAYHSFAPGTDFTALLVPMPPTACAAFRTMRTSSAARWTSSTRTEPSRPARLATCATGRLRTTSSQQKAPRSFNSAVLVRWPSKPR